MNTPPSYPIVQFLVRHGQRLSAAVGALLLLAAVAAAVAQGSAWIALGGALGAALIGGLLASYVEVLRIIADTLLPKY